MSFNPVGTLVLGHVPFDNSYQHTVIKSSYTSNAAVANDTIANMSQKTSVPQSGYTYIRTSGTIKVKASADSLYGINYLIFQNGSNNRYFMCFIDDVRYVNDNCSEIFFEIDVLRTWWDALNVHQAFVEREHVASDEFGEHLNTEPEFPMITHVDYSMIDDSFDTCMIVMATTRTSRGLGIVSDPAKGDVYNNVYQGAQYFAYSPTNVGINAINDDIQKLATGGVAESVVNVFMFPTDYLPSVNQFNEVNPNEPAKTKTHTIEHPTKLDGYTPHNNKLLTFPYSYCNVRHGNSESVEWRWELWGRDSQDKYKHEFTTTIPLDASASVVVIPQEYGGYVPESGNSGVMLTYPFNVQCSWTYDAFSNWFAQNATNIAFTAVGVGAGFTLAAGKGLRALNVAGKATASENAALMREYSANDPRMKTVARQAQLVGREEARPYLPSKSEVGIPLAGAAQLLGSLDRQMRQPNILNGNATGNTLCEIGQNHITIEKITLLREFAERLDGYFDMYGYQIDKLKIPEIFSRSKWNFVKTQNAANTGEIPSGALSDINGIFNKGITFWHDWNVGNYSETRCVENKA